MKTLLAAAALAALAAGAVQAQPDDQRRDERPAARPVPPSAPARPAPTARPAYQAPGRSYAPPAYRGGAYAPPARPSYQGPAQQRVAPSYNGAAAGDYRGGQIYRGDQGQYGGYRGDTRGAQGYGGANPGYQGGYRGGADRGQWNGQRSYYAQERFRAGGYQYPRGWYSRRWSYGEYLPFGWFAQNYWLDFGAYDLPPPPNGAEWVREGNDALLIDMSSGEVLSVEYGLFD